MKKNLRTCSFTIVMSIMMATSSFAGVAGKGINPVTNTTQQTQATTQQNTITNVNTAQAVEAAGGYIDQAMSQRLFNAASAARSRIFKSDGSMNQDIMDASGNYVINDTVLHANSVCQYVAEQRVKELASRNMQLSNGVYTTGNNRPFDMPSNNQELFKYYADIQRAHWAELEAYSSATDFNAHRALLLQYPENNMSFYEDFVQGANSAEEAVQMILAASKTEHFKNIYCDNGECYDGFNTALLNNNFSLSGAAAYNVNGKWYFDIVYDKHRTDLTNELYHIN